MGTDVIEVYKFILKEINGWSEERINKLTYRDIEGDPIFEGLKEVIN